jgi:hypothetical protein
MANTPHTRGGLAGSGADLPLCEVRKTFFLIKKKPLMMEKGPHPHGGTEGFLLFLGFFMYISSHARRCFQNRKKKKTLSCNTLLWAYGRE